MKHTRLILTGGIALLLAGAVLWQGRIFFLQNKVTFLLNQRQFQDAEALVDRLLVAAPDDLRVKFLEAKVQTVTGNYEDVAAASISAELADDSPEILYWAALAAFQTGAEAKARQLAKDFVSSGDNLPDSASMELAAKMAGNPKPLTTTDEDSKQLQLLFPVEQSVYLGLAALQEMNLGRTNRAADLFAKAFARDLRNKRLLLNACKAAAIAGNASQAEMFFAYSGESSIRGVFEELSQTYNQFKDITKAVHDLEVGGGGRLNVAYALAWASSQYLSENVMGNMYPVLRIMADLQQEYPYDRVLKSRMGVVMETLSRFDEAYSIYAKLYADAPNLAIALRTWCLEALPEKEVSDRLATFMDEIEATASLLPEQMVAPVESRSKELLSFHQDGMTTGSIFIPKSGTYMITLVGRGDKAFGKWPLVKPTVDDKPFDYLYICRDCWDCYSFTLVLDEGPHTIQIDYANDQDGIVDKSEDRSFYMKSIFVTTPGGA